MNFLLLGAVTQDKEVETYKSHRKIIDTRALPKRLEKTQKEKERIERENQDPKDKISPLDRTRINQTAMKSKDKVNSKTPCVPLFFSLPVEKASIRSDIDSRYFIGRYGRHQKKW